MNRWPATRYKSRLENLKPQNRKALQKKLKKKLESSLSSSFSSSLSQQSEPIDSMSIKYCEELQFEEINQSL